MAKWTVTYIDNDSPDYQFASFKSKRDADIWILNQQQHSRYDANGFEVVDGPYDESKPRKNYPRKPVRKSKIWIDRFRPAPKGYDHIESVMDLDCMNYYVGLDGIFLIDIDGGKDEDGKDLIDDGLQYIADRVDRSIYVRFHGNDPKRKSRVDDAIKEYGWRHAYQSLHEELNEDENELSFAKFRDFAKSVDTNKLAANVTTAMFSFVADTFKVDLPSIKSENAKQFSKIESKLQSDGQLVPLFAVHYPSTGVNVLFANDFPLPKKISYTSFVKSALRFAKQSLRPSIVAIPFKTSNGNISLDDRDVAYLQCAMTLLLSDIEFDVLWPVKGDISSVMKYLDFICPSIMDVVGCFTLGGASIASRAAKANVKKAAKNEMKLIAKLQAKAPKAVKSKISKARKMSKLSRNMKSNLKSNIKTEV